MIGMTLGVRSGLMLMVVLQVDRTNERLQDNHQELRHLRSLLSQQLMLAP